MFQMVILRLAIRNLMRHSRRTALLAVLIAFGMAGLFVADAVFESTNRGLKVSFVGSLTGDASLCAMTESPYSLFGSEIPIVSTYESIPPISDMEAISAAAAGLASARASTRVVAGAAQMIVSGYALNAVVFGVDADTYFEVCPDVRLLKGDTRWLAGNGVFLSRPILEGMQKGIGRELVAGEQITFSIYINGSFRLRLGQFAGVHEYSGANPALDRVVLANPTLVRSLVDYTMGFALNREAGGDARAGAEAPAGTDGSDLSSLFSQNSDSVAAGTEGITLDEISRRMAETAERDTRMLTDSAAWSFMLFKAVPGREKRLLAELERLRMKNGWNVRIQDWRGTAGSAATLPYAVQIVFFIGLGFIMLGAILVVTNALVVSIMERIGEIGTMRGLGASSGFIRRLFVCESMLMTVGSSAIGILLGAFAAAAVGALGLKIGNPLLVSLMGGDSIAPVIGAANVLRLASISVAVGSLSWIYPVSVALRVQPAGAMGKGI